MPWRGGRAGETILRFAERLLLGGWIGSWVTFGLLVAPTAFHVLPSTEMAGRVVGPVISALHLYGLAAGVLLALIGWWLGRGLLHLALPLAAAALCAYTEFGVTPEIAALRPRVFGPEGTPELAARFQHLHGISVAIFLAVGLSTLALLAAQTRADTARSGVDRP